MTETDLSQLCTNHVFSLSTISTKDIALKTRDVFYTFMTYQFFKKGCYLTVYNPGNWYVIIKHNKKRICTEACKHPVLHLVQELFILR